MLYTGPWDLSTFPNVDYGVQILPGDQNHQTISGPDKWVLFDNGDDRRNAAWTFLKWFTSPTAGDEWSLATGDLPIRASQVKQPGYQAYIEKYPGIATFVENEQNAIKVRPVIAALQRDLGGDGAGDPGGAARQGAAASRRSTRPPPR